MPRYGPPHGELHPNDAALEAFAALKLHEQDTMSLTGSIGNPVRLHGGIPFADPAFRTEARASLRSEAIKDRIKVADRAWLASSPAILWLSVPFPAIAWARVLNEHLSVGEPH